MSASYVVAATGNDDGYRKPPVAPLNSTSKTGLDTILGAWLVMVINCNGWLLRDAMLCSVGG